MESRFVNAYRDALLGLAEDVRSWLLTDHTDLESLAMRAADAHRDLLRTTTARLAAGGWQPPPAIAALCASLWQDQLAVPPELYQALLAELGYRER